MSRTVNFALSCVMSWTICAVSYAGTNEYSKDSLIKFITSELLPIMRDVRRTTISIQNDEFSEEQSAKAKLQLQQVSERLKDAIKTQLSTMVSEENPVASYYMGLAYKLQSEAQKILGVPYSKADAEYKNLIREAALGRHPGATYLLACLQTDETKRSELVEVAARRGCLDAINELVAIRMPGGPLALSKDEAEDNYYFAFLQLLLQARFSDKIGDGRADKLPMFHGSFDLRYSILFADEKLSVDDMNVIISRIERKAITTFNRLVMVDRYLPSELFTGDLVDTHVVRKNSDIMIKNELITSDVQLESANVSFSGSRRNNIDTRIVSLRVDAASLEDVLSFFRQAVGVDIVFDSSLLKNDGIVSVDVSGKPWKIALEAILASNGLELIEFKENVFSIRRRVKAVGQDHPSKE